MNADIASHTALLLFIAFVSIGIGATAPAATGSPEHNAITFVNHSGEDATVKLIGPSARLIAVPSAATRTSSVAAGTYHILIRYGRPGDYRYAKGDPFTVADYPGRYTVTTVSLHTVADGNYSIRPSSDKEFQTARCEQEEPPFLAASRPSTQATRTDPPITVKGRIADPESTKKYISQNTYLQLVPVMKGGNVTLKVNGKGRLLFDSDLPRIPFPADGMFEFARLDCLKHGATYLVAVQDLNHPTKHAIWLSTNGDVMKFQMPPQAAYDADTKEIVIDLSNANTKLPL